MASIEGCNLSDCQYYGVKNIREKAQKENQSTQKYRSVRQSLTKSINFSVNSLRKLFMPTHGNVRKSIAKNFRNQVKKQAKQKKSHFYFLQV